MSEDDGGTVSLHDHATLNPRIAHAFAQVLIQGPSTIGGDADVTGGNGEFDAGLKFTGLQPGHYTAYFNWEGDGLGFTGMIVQSPTASFYIPHFDQGWKTNISSGGAAAAGVGLLSCGAAVVVGGVVLETGGLAGLPAGEVLSFLLQTCAGSVMGAASALGLLLYDPPDQNVGRVALPSSTIPPAPRALDCPTGNEACRQLTAALSAWAADQRDVAATQFALSVANNRMTTAESADDNESVTLQLADMNILSGQLDHDLKAATSADSALAQQMAATGFNVTADPGSLTAMLNSGTWWDSVPTYVIDGMRELGATKSQVSQLLRDEAGKVVDLGGPVDLRSVLAASSAPTEKLEAAWHSLTDRDLFDVVLALEHQGTISDDAGQSLRDLLNESYGECGRETHKTSLATQIDTKVTDPAARAYLHTAVQALPADDESCAGRPAITRLTPAWGPTHTVTQVTIHGRGLADVSDVEFGPIDATDITCTADSCTVKAPEMADPRDVHVTAYNDNGGSELVDAAVFRYYGGPAGPVHLPENTVVVDGGFEPPALKPESNYRVITAGSEFGLGPKWTVVDGAVDLVGPTQAQAAEGTQFLDLNGNTDEPAPATIEQKVATIPDHIYELSFRMSGNPNGDPKVKTVEVTAGEEQASETFDAATSTNEELAWEVRKMQLHPCTASIDLQLKSTTDGFRGPLLDAISIVDKGPSEGDHATRCAADPPSKSSGGVPWWIYVLIVAVLVIGGGAVLVTRRGR